MSTEITKPDGTNPIVARKKDVFKKEHELDDLVVRLKKLSKKALDRLEAALGSEDEKIALTAAEKLIKYQIDASKEVEASKLNRLIASLRFDPSAGNGTTAPDDSAPKINFDDIHPDFQDVDVVDLTDIKSIG